MTSLAVLISGALLLLLALIATEIRKYRLSQMSCEKLIRRLGPVETDVIALAALEDLDVIDGSRDIENKQIRSMLGGWHGLKQMHTNAGLLITLAARAQAWDLPGSAVAARSMRKDAFALRHSVMCLALEELFRYRKDLRLEYLKDAAASYYAMTDRLLRLYETSPSRLYTRLDTAIWPNLANSSRMLQA